MATMAKAKYGIEQALDEALGLLRERFGEPDQRAVVDLAEFLYSTYEREKFLREHPVEPRSTYG